MKKTSKKPRASKVTARKSVGKKVVKKQKKVFFDKKIGIFILIAGILALVALVSLALSEIDLASNNDNSVLGSTSQLGAPTEFRASADKYTAKLSWRHNAPSEDYKYKLFYYNQKLKTYVPFETIDVNETGPYAYRTKYGYTTFDGNTVTAKVDQTPGKTVIYKVALCKGDCEVSFQQTDGNITGWTAIDTIGKISSAAVLEMPKISAPTSLRVTTNSIGNRLSWKAIPGVDGYNIYRSSSYFGLSGYSMIGLVGTDGTYSTRHTFDADGTIGILPNVPSPTTYTDNRAIPGVKYYYKVVARKMIAPPTYARGWQYSYSEKSGAVNVVTAKIATPTIFRVLPRTRNMVQIVTNDMATSSTDGYYLYCDLCDEKKMELKQGPNIGFAGTNDQEHSMAFGLSGLDAGTRYSFQLTRFKIINGKTFESAKTSTQYVKTLAEDL